MEEQLADCNYMQEQLALLKTKVKAQRKEIRALATEVRELKNASILRSWIYVGRQIIMGNSATDENSWRVFCRTTPHSDIESKINDSLGMSLAEWRILSVHFMHDVRHIPHFYCGLNYEETKTLLKDMPPNWNCYETEFHKLVNAMEDLVSENEL